MPWWKQLLAIQNAIRRKMRNRSDFQETCRRAKKETGLQLYTFSRVKVATSNFSDIIGLGSFGPTYKGQLDGIEIAVKRISSRQHLMDVFKKEIEVTTGLGHRNVLCPRGYCFRREHEIICCCIEKGNNEEETILIYDYMPNKSLDCFLFDDASGKGRLLDWPERRSIIYGIAQGLVYLHEYSSEFTVIHLNIKPSNILLDHDMNPKIHNFGLARILPSGVTEDEGQVYGTFGYIAPEFLMRGICSVKSDVYSFGVTMLETISGKRCTIIHHEEEEHLPLQACRLWMDGKWHEIVDSTIYHTREDTEIRRFIHVALLCIQNDAEDRPTMQDVTQMLRHESIFRPEPKPLLRLSDLLPDQSEEGSEGELSVVEI